MTREELLKLYFYLEGKGTHTIKYDVPTNTGVTYDTYRGYHKISLSDFLALDANYLANWAIDNERNKIIEFGDDITKAIIQMTWINGKTTAVKGIQLLNNYLFPEKIAVDGKIGPQVKQAVGRLSQVSDQKLIHDLLLRSIFRAYMDISFQSKVIWIEKYKVWSNRLDKINDWFGGKLTDVKFLHLAKTMLANLRTAAVESAVKQQQLVFNGTFLKSNGGYIC